MSDQLKSRLRAILSRVSGRGESPAFDHDAWRPPVTVRIYMFVSYVISQACTLLGGGIKVFIVYPIGLLVFCALVLASINNDTAPDVRIVSGLYEGVASALEGAPSGHINLYKCADPVVSLDKAQLDPASSVCQNPSVTTVPLSEGIPLLAMQLTDPLRLFYAMAVILVFGVMLMSSRWSAQKAQWPGAIIAYGDDVGVSEARSMLHKSDSLAGNVAKRELGPHDVKSSV